MAAAMKLLRRGAGHIHGAWRTNNTPAHGETAPQPLKEAAEGDETPPSSHASGQSFASPATSAGSVGLLQPVLCPSPLLRPVLQRGSDHCPGNGAGRRCGASRGY